MKKVILASILISILFAGFYSGDVYAQNKKPMKGQIVSLDDIIKGKKDLQLTKESAEKLLENGSPLVFLHNRKIYFVQGTDGNFAFRRLANFAHHKNVGIVGKIKTVSGINYIIMEHIDKMD